MSPAQMLYWDGLRFVGAGRLVPVRPLRVNTRLSAYAVSHEHQPTMRGLSPPVERDATEAPRGAKRQA